MASFNPQVKGATKTLAMAFLQCGMAMQVHLIRRVTPGAAPQFMRKHLSSEA